MPRTPNYDSLHAVHKRKVDAKVMAVIGPRQAPRGVRVYERDPSDIDRFRELYAIELKAYKMQEALLDISAPRKDRQKRFDSAKLTFIRQVGGSAASRSDVFSKDTPPRRRDYASAVLSKFKISL